jgi:hypothetical protein
MVRVPRGLHRQASRRGPKLGWGPGVGGSGMQPIQRTSVTAYRRPVTGLPLTGGQGQSVISAGPAVPFGAPIQAVSATAVSLTTLSATIAATTAGNCLVVCLGADAATTNPTITGITLGGSADHWQAAATAYNSSFCNAAIWIDPNCAGGQTAIVITCTGGSGTNDGIVAWIFEVPGVAAAPLDAAPAGVNASGTSWSSGSTGVLAQASEIAFGVAACFGSVVTITGPAGPWTNKAQISVASSVSAIAGFQVVASTSALSYAGTLSATAAYGTAIATLKAGPAAGGALPAGQAVVTVGPQGLGNIWYPAQVTVSTTSGVNDQSVCNVYLGSQGVPVTLMATLPSGGAGTAGLAIPSMAPGQYLIAVWTGGNPGDVAAVNVTGTMDALST